MSAREAMLGRIRRSLGTSGADTARRAAVADRLARAPRGVIPARGALPTADRLALFEEMARGAFADVVRTASDAAPGIVAAYLAERELPATIRIGDDARLHAIRWRDAGLAVETGTAEAGDLAAVSHAEAGIAETGTAMMLSGAANPTLLNFLPLVHIVVVSAGDIVGDAETALERIRQMYGKGAMPRCVNLVTGPSRSGDIEQTMYLGAHGPRDLLVLVLTDI